MESTTLLACLFEAAYSLKSDRFKVEDYLGDFLFYALDGGELVFNPRNLNSDCRRTRERREKNTTQAVADSSTETALERLDYELGVVFALVFLK